MVAKKGALGRGLVRPATAGGVANVARHGGGGPGRGRRYPPWSPAAAHQRLMVADQPKVSLDAVMEAWTP